MTISLIEMDAKEDIGKRINKLKTDSQFFEQQIGSTDIILEELYKLN